MAWVSGSLNGINILDRSDYFDRILRGEAPTVNFVVNGHQYNRAYCLADGIYPNWPVFIKTIPEPVGNKRKHFAERQEACRKDVEIFGVLQSRWHILNTPCNFWSRMNMCRVMRACIILHNMIVEDQRVHPEGGGDMEDMVIDFIVTRPPHFKPRSVAATMTLISSIEDTNLYFKLARHYRPPFEYINLE